MRGHNDDQILPMLEYCLARDIELRFIELMNMGHLKAGTGYQDQFFGMEEILALIGSAYDYREIEAPYDSTAVRFSVADGAFGVIANESAPFCPTCSRLRLASNGFLYGCLSNSASHDLTQLVELPEAFAVAKLQKVLGQALADKQVSSFSGETTVMKFIGG